MKMNGKYTIFLLAAIVCAAALLPGCGTGNSRGVNGSIVPSGKASTGVSASANPASGTISTTESPLVAFADAFMTVDKNPLNEDIQLALWQAASKPAPAASAGPGAQDSSLQALVAQYQAVVADKGIHYTQATSMMGMQTTAEYWIKGGKFRKADSSKVTVFDGNSYVIYDSAKKTGTRYTKDSMSADIDVTLAGLLSKLAASPYVQQDDGKFGKFDCNIFYLKTEMKMLGLDFKGSWLYVDKATGMLVNDQTGDPKDKKNSMSIYVTSLAVGGFGDEMFTVPADVTVEDYKS